MFNKFKNICLLFLTIFIVVFIGFYKSYFGVLTDTSLVDNTMHTHAILLIVWFGLLVIQPILIVRKQARVHRILGILSYFIVPLIIYTMIDITRHQYVRETKELMAENIRIADLFLPLSQMLLFGVLYLLAMINKKNVQLHYRYIITSSLVLLAPGLERIPIYWFNQPEQPSTLFAFIVTDIFILWLIYADRGRSHKNKAYVISLFKVHDKT